MDLQAAQAYINQDHRIYDRLIACLPGPDLSYAKEKVMEITGVFYPTLFNTITGKTTNPNIKIVKALAFVLNCTIDEVLDPEYEFRPLRANGREELAASLGLSRDAA